MVVIIVTVLNRRLAAAPLPRLLSFHESFMALRRAMALLATMALCWGAVPAARAIPEAEALRKLQVVPVLLITDEKGIPLPIPRGKTLVLPLFLDYARAEAEWKRFRQANPGIRAQIIPVPLNVANERIAQMRRQIKEGYTLVSPPIPLPRDLEIATKMLRQQGVSEEKIRKGLTVPVFFTKPFLTLRTPEGERGVFFLSHGDMQAALARFPGRDALKPQVADLTAVLREIVRVEKDNYIFYPTQEYFRLQQLQKTAAGGAAAPGSPSAGGGGSGRKLPADRVKLQAPPPPPPAP